MIEALALASLIQQVLFSSGEGEGPPFFVHEAQVFNVTDSEPDGDLDDADLEAALAACDVAAPRGGCDVVLGAGNYLNVNVEVGPHVRFFRGQGQASTTITGPATPTGDPIILREPRDGGWPTIFEDFTVDGNKQNLTADPGDHNCIKVGDPTASQLAGGIIRRVTCQSVAKEGFQIEDAPGWSFIDNELRYLGCHQNWSPDGIIAASLMDCGPWAEGQPDDDNQPGRTTPGIGIEIQRNSHDAVVTGNLVEFYTKIAIQGIDSDSALEPSYPRNGLVRGNTVRWGLSGISAVRTNDWWIDQNTITDIGASWQFGNVGAGTSCSFAGRRTRFTSNDIRRTAGSGMGIACDCGATIGNGLACDVVVTGNSLEDVCLQDTTWGTFFADNSGVGDAIGLTVTGNTITNSLCPVDLNLDGYTGVTTDLVASVVFTVTEPLITTEEALDSVLATVPATMVSDHGTATSLAARSFSAQTFDFDLPQEAWTDGDPNCVPSVSSGGTYDLSGAARSIFELALDFRVNGDVTAGDEAHDQLLNFAGGSGYDEGTLSRANQCALDLSEAIPNLVNAALLLESGGLPAWSVADRVTLADWVIARFPLISWTAEGNANNWGAAGMRAAHAAAAFVDGYAPNVSLWDTTPITPAAYYATRMPNTVFPAFLAGGQDTCFDDPSEPTGMQSSGALPEEMRRSPTPAGDVANCSETTIDFACTGSPPFDALGECGGDTGAPFYQGKAIQALVGLAEEHFNLTGSTALYTSTSHGGANEALYDGLLMATTLGTGSLGDFQDVYARDGVIGGFLLAAEYYDDGCMANVLRDSTADPFTDLRGGNDLPWMSILAFPGVRDLSPAPACGGAAFTMLGESALASIASDIPTAHQVPAVDTTGWTEYDVTTIAPGTPAAGKTAFPSGPGCSAWVAGGPDNSAAWACMLLNMGEQALLYFPDGVYNVGTPQDGNSIFRPEAQYRRRGMVGESRNAIINFTHGYTTTMIPIESVDPSDPAYYNAAATSWNGGSGDTKGATVIPVASTAGFSLTDFADGSWVELRADYNSVQGGTPREWKTRVTAINPGVSITIRDPLPDDFNGGNATARAWNPAEEWVFRSMTWRHDSPWHFGSGYYLSTRGMAHVEISDMAFNGAYQDFIRLIDSADVRMHGNDLWNSHWDKGPNGYGMRVIEVSRAWIHDNHIEHGTNIAFGAGSQELLVTYNDLRGPGPNGTGDAPLGEVYDVWCQEGDGNDCLQELGNHSHATTVGAGFTHCANNSDDVLGLNGDASCRGTRAGSSYSCVEWHNEASSGTLFMRNYCEASMWFDDVYGPGRNNFFFGNWFRDTHVDGTPHNVVGRGQGGFNFVGGFDLFNRSPSSGYENNSIFANNLFEGNYGDGYGFNTYGNGMQHLDNVIAGACRYRGTSDPSGGSCTQVANDPATNGSADVWTNNQVGARVHASPRTMPSVPGFSSWDEIPFSVTPDGTPPYLGPELGDPDLIATPCLPAWKRFNGGSC